MNTKKKIFIVEDEAITVLAIERTLEYLGFEILGHAATGEECLTCLETIKPDLILMDVGLKGGLNGIKTASEIWEKYFIPVVFITGESTVEIIDQVKESNPYGYISKPFQTVDLLSGIELAFHKHAFEKKLMESESKYRNLVNTIDEGIIQVSLLNNTVEYINDKFCEMLELRREEVIEKDADKALYFFEQQKDALPLIRKERLEGISRRYELKIITRSGNEKWFLVSGTPIKGQGNIIVSTLGIWLDITVRKSRELQLRKFYYAIEQSDENIIVTNKDGIIEYVNPAFCEVSGYSIEEIKGKNTAFLKSGKHSDSFYQELWNTINSGKSFQAEFINKKKNGGYYIEEKIITPLLDENGVIINFISTGRDITEKKRIERKIDAYKKFQNLIERKHTRIRTLSLIQGQEEERKRISRDLHDGLGQILTATKINFEAMNINELTKDNQNQDLKRIYNMVIETIREVRRISNDLSPANIHDFGLLSAIKTLVCNINESQKQFTVTLNSNIEQLRFNSDIEINIYRIIQECLNNSMKHSNCTLMDVSINIHNETLKVSVSDNGVGFNQTEENFAKEKSFGGLKNIQERANIIGGELNIISEPGNGVFIFLIVKTKTLKDVKDFIG